MVNKLIKKVLIPTTLALGAYLGVANYIPHRIEKEANTPANVEVFRNALTNGLETQLGEKASILPKSARENMTKEFIEEGFSNNYFKVEVESPALYRLTERLNPSKYGVSCTYKGDPFAQGNIAKIDGKYQLDKGSMVVKEDSLLASEFAGSVKGQIGGIAAVIGTAFVTLAGIVYAFSGLIRKKK